MFYDKISVKKFPLKTSLMSFLTSLLLVLGVLNWTIRPTKAATNYLHTSSSQILDASNNPVGLSGLNWFGFETANYAPHGLWARNWGDMLDQIKNLGYNTIRLPFSNAMLQPGVAPAGIDYTKNPDLKGLSPLEVMDKIVAGASARGIKIILDNHRSTPGGGPETNGLWYTSDFPESRWISDWQMLVNRYKDEPSVIGVDLRNEPHDSACWGCGDTALDWRLAAEKAGNAVLAVNPNLLIIVEGVGTYNGQSTWWGGNLMGAKDYPIRLNIPGRLVYSPHEYPESVAPQPWFNDPNYPNNLPAVWDSFWGYLVKDQTAPILVGEFGTKYQTTKDRQWIDSFKNYIQQNGLNWTFWALNPDSGDTGGLLLDDWISVDQSKQDILKQIQYDFIGSTYQPVTPTPSAMPVPTATPTPTQVSPTPVPGGTTFVLDDFESGDTAQWNTFKDASSTISTSIVSPGKTGKFALKLNYSLGSSGWGGAGQGFNQSQDWSTFNSFSFQFYGTNSGHTIQLELLDDRAPGSNSDTSERFVYQFSDNFSGWKTFSLPWSSFSRRTDWQPSGAPNNGLTLSQMWGIDFSPLKGSGSFQLDQIQLEQVASSPKVTILDNFETGNTNGWITFNDPKSSLQIQAISPGQASEYAMLINANLTSGGWGGAQMVFATPQDWSAYSGIDYWVYGSNSGNPMRLEVLDNPATGSSGDTYERFEYRFTDNWSGWKHFSVKWSEFSRRSDWQPDGAPNDGFTRTKIGGFNFAPLSGKFSIRVDEIGLLQP